MISDQEIAEKAAHINSMHFTQKIGVINEFYDMWDGGTADGIRQEYYPDWSNSDFARLLILLGEGD